MTYNSNSSELNIGLALSGGGARAIAFQLGCLRTLNDRGILKHVKELSTVSAGSILGAMYAYSDDKFQDFDDKVQELLRVGFMNKILEHIPWADIPKFKRSGIDAKSIEDFVKIAENPKTFCKFDRKNQIKEIINAIVLYPEYENGIFNEAFEKYLDSEIFFGGKLADPTRKDIKITINATELSTNTALYFCSNGSNNQLLGEIGEAISISKAIVGSAAHPLFLPRASEKMKFIRDSNTLTHNILISDGGVYDNTGTDYFFNKLTESTNGNLNCIIACLADRGLDIENTPPNFVIPRMQAVLKTPFTRSALITPVHLKNYQSSGALVSSLTAHLGMDDNKIKNPPNDLVKRDSIKSYPTNFSPMSDESIRLLSKRGEQLTDSLLEPVIIKLVGKSHKVKGLNS